MEAAAAAPKKLKALFVDAGPRKKNNTAQLLESAMKGASEAGAEASLVRLYELNFTGCKSCFACTLKNAKTDGVCALKDDLRPVLEQARQADIIVVGSPVYFSFPTGMMRCFLERLMFANHSYDLDAEGHYLPPMHPKKTAIIYSMNCPEDQMERYKYDTLLGASCDQLRMIFGHSEALYSCDTLQFSDYSKYASGMFNEEHKRKHHDEQFPVDLKKAYELGKHLVEICDAK